MIKNKIYTISQGITRAKDYCSIQERSQKDVENKLKEWGLNQKEADQVIAELIIENFINEQRYAELYIKSKFNQNKWGRIKIRHSLREKGISEKCIDKAMEEIDEKEYISICLSLSQKKYDDLKAEQHITRKRKTISFLLSRGFEYDIIQSVLKEIV